MKQTFLSLTILIFSWNISIAQNPGFIQINTNNFAQFIVTDPQGRKTGCDPGGAGNSKYGKFVNEIPGSNYSFSSVGDIPEPGKTVSVDYGYEFTLRILSSEANGLYTLELIGTDSGRFNLHVSMDTKQRESINFSEEGIIGKNELIFYEFAYSDNPADTIYLKKIRSQTGLHSFKIERVYGCEELLTNEAAQYYNNDRHRAVTHYDRAFIISNFRSEIRPGMPCECGSGNRLLPENFVCLLTFPGILPRDHPGKTAG